MDSWEANEIAYAHILSRSWLSDDFKDRLLKNPSDVLRANGFTLPANANVQVKVGGTSVQWNPTTSTLILPLPNRPATLSDMDILTQDVGNDVTVCSSCCCSCA